MLITLVKDKGIIIKFSVYLEYKTIDFEYIILKCSKEGF